MNKNVAIILAGGVGSRFGLNVPKQFAKLAGKSIIEYTITIFQNHPLIDEICIVSKKEWIWKLEELVNINSFTKVKKIIEGGEERKDSSLSAINSYEFEGSNINLLFHDAVRPFVSNKVIDECVEKLKKFNAIDVAIPATDTIINVNNSIIEYIPNRNELMQGQTPQCFKIDTIREAYRLAEKDVNFKPTDDCGVVKKYLPNENIYVIKGELSNIKITHGQDIFVADKLIQLKYKQLNFIHPESYYQEKLKNKVVVVFGGSYGIGKDIANLAKQYGAKVYSFSRSATNTNVALKSDVKRDLAYVYDQANKIDYVVNTASVLIKEPLTHTSYDDIINIININYMGAIIVAKESIKYLEETSGQLLNFTSSSYTRGRANYSLYSSTKAAIVNLTQALGDELYNRGVRVNCINPERTLTPMRIRNFGKEDPSLLLKSEEVAMHSINTLLSDMTGQIIDVKVDGVKVNE